MNIISGREARNPLLSVPGQSFPRWVLSTLVVGLCGLLMVHVWGLEAFVVPTGSMAPALYGHHRSCPCPGCGFPVRVGRQPSDRDGRGKEDCYRRASCPNCGYNPLPLGPIPETNGDHILVNKSAFVFRRPRRWEIIVFRLFGKVFVKRIIGLPGEWLEIFDGDIYVNGVLARKNLAELKTLGILVFDHGFQPPKVPSRWEKHSYPETGYAESISPEKILLLDASRNTADQWLVYRHFSQISAQDEGLRDEYAYNGGQPGGAEAVHDFLVDCDLEAQGTGTVKLALTDGLDVVCAELPVGGREPVRLVRLADGQMSPRGEGAEVLARGGKALDPGRRYHVEMAFADRRVILAVDGREILVKDLAPGPARPPVGRPVSLGARALRVEFHHVRLFRDIFYTQAGKNGVHGKAVRLGKGQYFVMGDNSPNSEDSRFWPRGGVVPARNIVGKPFLIHLPSRVLQGRMLGENWHIQVPDWKRLRWLP